MIELPSIERLNLSEVKQYAEHLGRYVKQEIRAYIEQAYGVGTKIDLWDNHYVMWQEYPVNTVEIENGYGLLGILEYYEPNSDYDTEHATDIYELHLNLRTGQWGDDKGSEFDTIAALVAYYRMTE